MKFWSKGKTLPLWGKIAIGLALGIVVGAVIEGYVDYGTI